MNERPYARRRRTAVSVGALAAALTFGGMAVAQTASTSAIRGTAAPGAEVVVRNVATGFTGRDTVGATGSFVIRGLQPGTYQVTVGGQTRTVRALVGETAVVEDASEEATTGDEIVVVARPRQDVTTQEVATNVTREQIETLPQLSRNFLNFAALAPGVRVQPSNEELQITAGGQRAEAINAFIDGASLKSNIIAGGIIGQDDSPGNPFPLGAVQEFRVITQNFGAQYEQASSAVVTAVTRSGTNRFEGEVFGTYRDNDFVEQDEFAKRRGDTKPDLEFKQYGFLVAGPILQDKLHYLFSYERKEEGRVSTVDFGGFTRADVENRFRQYRGTFASPFEQDLYFGKLSWQPTENQRLDLSVTYRDESNITGIGGTNSVERANSLNQSTTGVNLRHQWQFATFQNEFAIDYRSYKYNPGAQNFGASGRNYRVFNTPGAITSPGFDAFGGRAVVNIGGADSRQDIEDNALTFRNDVAFDEFEWNGTHALRIGGKLSLQNYKVQKEFGRNPSFFYDLDGLASGSVDVPYRVELGQAFPNVDLDNTVIGLYVQDDWRITDKLEINLGLRWDYEDNSNNADYRTPDTVRAGIAALPFRPSWFNPADYISDGNRDPYAKMFQPRLGFSYDVFGDRNTVIFGGAGRYYDRINFNFSYDELVKPFDIRRNAFFSTTGRAAGVAAGTPQDPILWRPEYATAAGLDPVLNALPGKGEVFLLRNEFEPPRTDQFNLGVRQRFGEWQTEFTLAYGKTENEFTWLYVNRCAEPTRPADGGGFGDNGGFCGPGGTNPFRGYLASDHNKEREFTALYVKADKPYTRASGWGLNLAYTLSQAEQNGGNDAFCFDCFDVKSSPQRPTDNDETHRLVASGIHDLPFGFQVSGILTLGSGVPYDVFDARKPQFYYRPKDGRPDEEFLWFAYRNLDLRLTKSFDVFEGQELEIYLDAINVFNWQNYTGFEGFTGGATSPNPNFGKPGAVLYPTRSFQIGARYKF